MGYKKPLEIKIQLTEKCNYDCTFCFNRQSSLSFSRELSFEDAKKIISTIASDGIEKVRFTGGEPLLYPKLSGLLSFAKKKGLYTMLNTNASLFDEKKAKKIGGNTDNVLVSLHSLALPKKVKFAVKALAKQGCFVRAATILTKENINQLEKFYSVVSSIPFSQWVLLRQIPNALDKNPVSCKDMQLAVEKIEFFNSQRKKKSHFLIENAVPFCCFEPKRVSKIALGGIHEDGHSSLFAGVDKVIKPSYFFDIKLGNATKDSFLDTWKSDFMIRMNSLEFIPEICHACPHILKCMAGSRFSAFLANKSLYGLDPLANSLFLPKALSEINK